MPFTLTHANAGGAQQGPCGDQVRPGRQRAQRAPRGRGRLLVQPQYLLDAKAGAPGRRVGRAALRLVAVTPSVCAQIGFLRQI